MFEETIGQTTHDSANDFIDYLKNDCRKVKTNEAFSSL